MSGLQGLTELRSLAYRKLPRPARESVASATLLQRQRGLTAADRFLIHYPKAGSTWLRCLLYDAAFGEAPDFDDIRRDIPPIGHHRDARPVLPDGGRIIHTHHPVTRLRTVPPFLYLVRDPRSLMVSYHRYLNGGNVEQLSLDATIERFLEGTLDSHGRWQDHAESARTAIEAGQAHLIRYESLLSDPVTTLGAATQFLGLDVDTKQLATIIDRNDRASLRSVEKKTSRLAGRTESFVGTQDRSKFDELLSEAQIERLNKAIGPQLEYFDYS